MKSWRTTALGVIAAALMLTGAHWQDPTKPWIDSSQIPAALALMGLGAAAKDAHVHSTVEQAAEASERERTKVLDSVNQG